MVGKDIIGEYAARRTVRVLGRNHQLAHRLVGALAQSLEQKDCSCHLHLPGCTFILIIQRMKSRPTLSEDFPGGGETGELIRTFDWSTTPLGPRADWSLSLKAIVRMLMNTRQPMILWWGPELTQIYNDAMLESMRDKHPRGMGEPGREAWREAWRVVGHELERVVSHGDMIWNEDMFVPVDRSGILDDAYWTYSYSPVFDDDGTRVGMIIICTETTAGVVARKQLERAHREAHIAREELRSAFMQAPNPIAILIGADNLITLANPAYEVLVGRPVVGKKLREAFTLAEVGYYEPLLARIRESGEPLILEAAELNLVGPDGAVRQRYIDVGYHPYRNTDGQTIGVIALVNDVTASVQARQASERLYSERAATLAREQELRRAAETGERARDEFLAMLGHELRNPLAPITTAIELMRMNGDRHPKERSVIERQVAHLSQLVDDLLDVARVTRGKLELRRAPVVVAEVIGKAIEMASPLLERGEHELRQRIEPGLLVDGDAVRLAQVASNLLTNAAKYTPPHGLIEVTAGREQGDVVLTVADNGPGIAPALMPRIFELFVQGEQRADRAAGGLGLGLALVRNLVTMHGGTVTVANRPSGGCAFTVRLPALDAPTVLERRDSPSRHPDVVPAPLARRVLVVDDNVDAAQLLADLLKMKGHQVVVAHDGPQALTALETFPAEIGFLDLGLPGMDGFELARRIRAAVPAARLQLVAVTGYGQARDREQSRAAGFDAHLTKPVAMKDILRLVATES